MPGRSFEKTLDVAATGKMFANGAQHDHAHAGTRVQSLEHQTQLIALRHDDEVERRPIEDDVGAFFRAVDFYAEAVQRVSQG